jgi:hypothetical protein
MPPRSGLEVRNAGEFGRLRTMAKQIGGKSAPLYVSPPQGVSDVLVRVTSEYFRIFLLSASGYANFRSRSHNAVIRVYNPVGNVIDTDGHASGAVKHPLLWQR